MIIDNQSQLQLLKNKSIFLYPVLEDGRLHICVNNIIAFVMIDCETKETYSLSNGHPDGIYNSSDLSFLSDCTVYSYDTAYMTKLGYDTSKFIDAKFQFYLKTNQPCIFETPAIIKHYARYFPKCEKTGIIVPLQKHEEIALNLFSEIFVKDIQPGLQFYQESVLKTFTRIEHNGIKINEELFTERFGETYARKKDICYTQYNYYTTAGRPSNRFGGINFAALNKEDGTRECFISRYADEGALVEIDFNSYHPRLIAELIGYDFKGENAYEHLAKHYNNTDTPTQENIDKAKEMTFRQIYGGIQQQYIHIPFFASIEALAQEIWREANSCGFVECPTSGRRLILANYQDVSCFTLFNYFIQMYETERNVTMLSELFKTLDKDIIPILYTYDSILFDLPKDKRKLLQESLQKVIPSQFPFKIKIGNNYGDLQ